MHSGRAARRGILVPLVAGSLALSLGLGARQCFGLLLDPLAAGHGVSVATTALAVALHNLVWGLAQPAAGAWADRAGAAPVVAAGGMAFAAGLALVALVPTGWSVLLGLGLLTGLGIAGLGFGVVLAAVGRAAPPEARGMALGVASAGGSLGQVLLVPVAAGGVSAGGAALALMLLAAATLAAAPLGWWLERRPPAAGVGKPPVATPLRALASVAFGDPSFALLTAGFFACGFQLAFLATHLPAYLQLCGLPMAVGAGALAAIGLFNIAGSLAWGWAGARLAPPQACLAALYALRALAALAYWFGPKTTETTLLFAAAMGLLWLGTVPLTSGLIARLFGTEQLGFLFGLAFLSHQLGGFLGALLGGVAFANSGSYDAVWAATVALGLIAAALNLPIRGGSRAVAPR